MHVRLLDCRLIHVSRQCFQRAQASKLRLVAAVQATQASPWRAIPNKHQVKLSESYREGIATFPANQMCWISQTSLRRVRGARCIPNRAWRCWLAEGRIHLDTWIPVSMSLLNSAMFVRSISSHGMHRAACFHQHRCPSGADHLTDVTSVANGGRSATSDLEVAADVRMRIASVPDILNKTV